MRTDSAEVISPNTETSFLFSFLFFSSPLREREQVREGKTEREREGEREAHPKWGSNS